MGRFGEFFDQDQEEPTPTQPEGRQHAGPGGFFDQDAPAEPPRPDRRSGARRQAADRQRDRELELRREADREREREARRRAREAPRPAPPAMLRISSRPVPAPPVRPPPPPPEPRRPVRGRDAPAPTADVRRRPAPGPERTPPPTRRAPPAAAERQAADRSPSMGRATAVLAAGTFASRLTGFLRVLAIGYVLGVGSLSDAFNYANGVPNIVYDLVIGGVLSATLIPVFVEQLGTRDRRDGERAVSAVLTAITAALAAVTVLLWLLAPWIIRFYLILNHESSGPAERALATRLLHFFAPQVFFLGGIVVTTALLNARRRFTAAAFSPVLNNLIAIGALLATKVVASHILTARSASPTATLERFASDRNAIWILGIGTTAGYLVQLLVQLPALGRTGIRLRPVWQLGHPAVRRVARLSSWLMGVVVANQVALALVAVLAGRTSGGWTAYQFAYQFFQLPYALVAVSIASALMPDLSERWTAGDRRGFERQFVVGLRVTLAILIPAGLVYAAVAQPFIQVAVHHGRVTGSGSHLVGSSLALFALGLPGFSAFFMLMRAYQAMQQARAMFLIYVLENAITVVAALALEPSLGVSGLALAWSGPYTIAAVVAAVDLRHRVGRLGGAHTVRALMRITLAGGVAGGLAWAAGLLFRSGAGDALLVGRLIVQVGIGTVSYLLLARVFGIKELRPVVRLARRMAGV